MKIKAFGVSDKHTGPWHGEMDRADQALAKGRAMWGRTATIYVAMVAPLNPADFLPSSEVLLGDLSEALVEAHGSGADAIFDNRKIRALISHWWINVVARDFLEKIESVTDIDFMVASKVKAYSPDNEVRASDFK
jgi:hypothetical protein